MKRNIAYTLVEVMVTMSVIAFLAVLTVPTILSGKAQKIYYKGYAKAFGTLQDVTDMYLRKSDAVFLPTQENIAEYVKYFAEHTSIKGLYAEANPTASSKTYAALKFKDVEGTAGAKNPSSVSPEIEIGAKPTFWIVTDDNLAYSFVIPDKANCDEKLNLNTLENLSSTIAGSCFVAVIDTNGIFTSPNTLDTTEDIANLDRVPNIKNDRYYVFMGRDGVTSGNPSHLFGAKLFDSKTNF